MTNAVRTPPTAFDPIPDRHHRLLAWIEDYRRAGVPLRLLADLFDIDRGTLIEAGVTP